MAGIKVRTNTVRLRHKVSPAAFKNGRRALANQIGMDTNRLIPKGPPNAGALRSSQVIAMDGTYIQWMMPYANRQYNAPAGWTYTTAGTGPRWVETAKARYIDSWKNALVKGAGL